MKSVLSIRSSSFRQPSRQINVSHYPVINTPECPHSTKAFVLLSWIFIVESDIDHGDDARLGQESHASSEYDNRNGESASL